MSHRRAWIIMSIAAMLGLAYVVGAIAQAEQRTVQR